MSVFVETVLSLDELLELKRADETKTPEGKGSFSAVELLAKRKAIADRYPTRPGLFRKNKIAAREIARTRHHKSMVKAERRIVLAKDRNAFNISLQTFDDAVSRIDFELSELKKSQGRPSKDDEDQQPKRKRAKVEKPRARRGSKSPKSESPKARGRNRGGKFRGSYEESDEEWEDEGDEGDEGDNSGDDPEMVAVADRLRQLEKDASPVVAPMES